MNLHAATPLSLLFTTLRRKKRLQFIRKLPARRDVV
jgi:hypothetical protein